MENAIYVLRYACNGKHAVTMIASHRTRRPVLWAAFFSFLTTPLVTPQSAELAEQSRRGKELMAEGRFSDAAEVYRGLVKALPGNSGLLLNLGMAEEMAGQPALAAPHLEAVLKTQPGSVPALTSLAMARLQLKQPAMAETPLRKLIALNPRDVNARGMLAGAEMSLGKLNAAAGQYRELAVLAPADPKAWYGLGKAYEAQAADSFERLAKAAPHSDFMALLLADSRLQRGQYRSAFFFYRQAAKENPELLGSHHGLAQVYQKTGHPDWAAIEENKESAALSRACGQKAQLACQFARKDFKGISTTAEKSTNPPSLFWAARAYNELALDAFQKLGQLPESPEIHGIKAQILHDHGRDLEAAKEWQAALSLSTDKHDPNLNREIATSLFLARDYQNAIPLIKMLLSSEATSPDLNFMLGESLWRTQHAEEALPYLEAALRQNPNMLPAHAALGLALVSLSRNADAVQHLEEAVSLDDDGSLHYSLARAYQAAGETERARQNMNEYARIQRQNAAINGEVATEAEITAPQSN
jgi:tetratricopeptide (TPR) repeat protein